MINSKANESLFAVLLLDGWRFILDAAHNISELCVRQVLLEHFEHDLDLLVSDVNLLLELLDVHAFMKA